MFSVYAKLVKTFNTMEAAKELNDLFRIAAHEFDVTCVFENKEMVRNHIRLKGKTLESVQEALAMLEDNGLITNELQASCSVRELNYYVGFGLADLPTLQSAMTACQITNCILSYDAGDRYTIESETKFAVVNALAYINPFASEAALNSLVQEYK